MILRGYETSALRAVYKKFIDGKRRVLIVSPTGSGKTVIASSLIQHARGQDKRTLFVAHRRELIDQAAERFGVDGIRVGGRFLELETIQTLARRKTPVGKFEILVIDEAHHIKSETYERLLAQFPSSLVVGLTATPWRLDGKGLADVFEDSVVATTPQELIKAGYLCGYSGFAYLSPDLKNVPVIDGDYDKKELARRYSKSQVFGDIVDRYKKHAAGMRAVAFVSSVENSRALAAAFIAAGVRAEHLDHDAAAKPRRETFARVRSGQTEVLCNVTLATEGIDIPELGCCIMARPTQSLTLYLQMVGRVMRPKIDGRHARIHDHAENIVRHGLPDAERDYSMRSTRHRSGSRTTPPNRTGPKFFDRAIEVEFASISKNPSKAVYLARRRAECKRNGICQDCAQHPVMEDSIFCQGCKESRTIGNRARKEGYRAAGLCKCGRVRLPGRMVCASCSESNQKTNKGRNRKPKPLRTAERLMAAIGPVS